MRITLKKNLNMVSGWQVFSLSMSVVRVFTFFVTRTWIRAIFGIFDNQKDMSLLLLLQLLPPQVILLQFKLNDVHTQSSDLEVGDQPMELGETGEKRKKNNSYLFQNWNQIWFSSSVLQSPWNQSNPAVAPPHNQSKSKHHNRQEVETSQEWRSPFRRSLKSAVTDVYVLL